jgi:hypothetical protein
MSRMGWLIVLLASGCTISSSSTDGKFALNAIRGAPGGGASIAGTEEVVRGFGDVTISEDPMVMTVDGMGVVRSHQLMPGFDPTSPAGTLALGDGTTLAIVPPAVVRRLDQNGKELWHQSFSVIALVDLALADDGALLVLGSQSNGGTVIKLQTDSSIVWNKDITSLP